MSLPEIMYKRKSIATFGIFVVLIPGVLALLLAAHFRFKNYFIEQPRQHLVQSVKVGMSRSEVTKRLGSPKNVAHSLSEIKNSSSFFPTPTEAPEKEILEYYGDPYWKIYVYIDHNDNVYKVLLART